MVKEHLLQGVYKDTSTLVEDYVSVKVVVWCGVVEGVAEHSNRAWAMILVFALDLYTSL